MKKIELINKLRLLAQELEPFTQEVKIGSRIWNGVSYAQPEAREADSYALMWWGILTEIIDLLQAQDTELGAKQVEHLRCKLVGGMGSFNDYCIDTKRGGDLAKAANQRLNEKRTELFKLFQ